MQTLRHAHLHALVVGRMELDAVEPAAFAVKGSEAGWIVVGKPPPFEGLGAAARGAERAQARHGMHGPFAVDRFHERRVGGEEVDVLEGRALVEDFVGGEWGGHGRLPGLIRARASLSTVPGAREMSRRAGLRAGRSQRIGAALMTNPAAKVSFVRRHLLTCENLSVG